MTEEEVKSFDPDAHLSDTERVELATTMASPGFKVIQKIFKSSVDRLGANLMNVSTGDDAQIIAKHRDWRVAAQLYTVLVQFLNREKEAFTASRPNYTPVDSGEGLDMGEFAQDVEEEAIV